MDRIQPFLWSRQPQCTVTCWFMSLPFLFVCFFFFFITQMVSLLQISVYGTEELRWWGGCSYGSVLLWTLTVHNHRTKRGHVNNSKHVLMCKLAAKKDHFRHENVHGYRKTYNLINCLQVGAIIWYCVFIWMEHACCLGVKENLVYLHFVFKCQKGADPFCTISYGKHMCFNMKHK